MDGREAQTKKGCLYPKTFFRVLYGTGRPSLQKLLCLVNWGPFGSQLHFVRAAHHMRRQLRVKSYLRQLASCTRSSLCYISQKRLLLEQIMLERHRAASSERQ